jgi:hypothetical protein
MRPDVVVVPTPAFDQDARLSAAAEPLDGQALVAELAVEVLVSSRSPLTKTLSAAAPRVTRWPRPC